MSPDGRLLVCVRERHEEDGVVNDIVALTGRRRAERLGRGRLATTSSPRRGISPDGRRLAYVCWDHPRMPWDGTELHLDRLDAEGRAGASALVAGGESESVVQPSWTPDGDLHFVSDRSGWWNLYRRDREGAMTALAPLAAEFAKPLWVFGLDNHVPLPDGRRRRVLHARRRRPPRRPRGRRLARAAPSTLRCSSPWRAPGAASRRSPPARRAAGRCSSSTRTTAPSR